jgi:hypothetical protein
MTLSDSAASELASYVAEPLGGAGAAFYFNPDTLAKGKELGLKGMHFYMIGRGGVLGDVHSDVVASAFGYFHKDAVAGLWNSAKDVLAPRAAGALYAECCANVGRAKLADVEGLDGFIDAGEAVIAAVNPAGLSLFAGLAAELRVDDAPGHAIQVAAVLRELRGSAHLNALVASGIVPEVAHAVKRPEMIEPFGWSADLDTSSFDQGARDEAEALTNKMLAPAFSGLTDEQAVALQAGAAGIAAALA